MDWSLAPDVPKVRFSDFTLAPLAGHGVRSPLGGDRRLVLGLPMQSSGLAGRRKPFDYDLSLLGSKLLQDHQMLGLEVYKACCKG